MELDSKSPLQGRPGVRVGQDVWVLEYPPTLERIGDTRARVIADKIRTALVGITSFVLLILAFLPIILEPARMTNVDFWTGGNWSVVGIVFSVIGFSFLAYIGARRKLGISHIPTSPGPHEIEIVQNISRNHRKRVDDVLSTEARESLNSAFEYAYKARHAEIGAFHIFLGVAGSTSVRMLFTRLGVDFSAIVDVLKRHAVTLPQGKTDFGQTAQELVLRAFINVLSDKRHELTPIELFIEAFKESDFLKELFYSIDVEESEVMAAAEWMRINEQLRDRIKAYRTAAAFKPTGPINRAYTSVNTPFLDQVSTDLTALAVKGGLPLLVGRDAEMAEIFRSIEGGGRSVVLVGASGVGKSALIAGVAEAMVEESVPNILRDQRLVEISVPKIISASTTKPEERLLYALQEAGMSGHIVLVIQGVDQLLQASPTLISILATELEKRYTFMIATSSAQGWRALEQTSLIGTCSPVRIEEPSRDDALRILESRIGGIEYKNQVTFTFEAVAACVDLSMRYLHDLYLPEKAIVVAQEVAISARRTMQKSWGLVTKAHVADVVSQKSRVPVQDVTKDEKAVLLNLEEKMHGRVIGQDAAVSAVSAALRRARTQLRSTNRPIANFLFLGPTGVGKTELAKTTAETFFGNENAMIRFDMSEYQDIASIERLIGANGQGGQLTESVRKQPFALLLLDELEKAHPDLLNLFLQVMDDGRLTDGAGRVIDFTNVIMIATSNAGTSYIQDQITAGTPLETIKTYLLETELRTIYRPEFLNRFDDVIVFKPLTQEDVIAIAYLMIAKVKDRLEAKGINFSIEDSAVHAIAKQGYDPKFGARPLRRVIQDQVDNKIADLLLAQDIKRRDTIHMKEDLTLEVVVAKAL